MIDNIHRTAQTNHSNFKPIDRGAGVIATLKVEGKGYYVITGNTFRGLNFTLGGSALKHDGNLDDYYFQTAAREFNEESFGTLVEQKLKYTLSAFIKPWGLDEIQTSALENALDAISKTDTFTKLSTEITEEILKLITPAESGAKLTFKRMTYVSYPVDVTQNDLDTYLKNASIVANILNSLFTKKLEEAKTTLASARSIEPKDVPFNDAKKVVEDSNPRLSDFAESKAIGVISVADALAAIKFNHNIPVEFATNTTKSDKISADYTRKISISTSFYDGSKTENIDIFGASLKPIDGVIGRLSRMFVNATEVAQNSTNFAEQVLSTSAMQAKSQFRG